MNQRVGTSRGSRHREPAAPRFRPRGEAPPRRPVDGDGDGDGAAHPARRPAERVMSLDAVRGLAVVILLVTSHPGPRDAMPSPLTHADWNGLTFADLFFPLFLFAVGAAIPFSRRAASARTALRRVALLFVMGVALEAVERLDASLHTSGVLQHIAIAYLVAWAVLRTPPRWWVPLSGGLLAAVWLAHVLVAGPGDDPWGRDGTAAHLFDTWVHGSFRTEGAFQSVTSAVNVVAGAFAGRLVLRRTVDRTTLGAALRHTVVLFVVGLGLALFVPVNKQLWTPSFAVVSAAFCFASFAAVLWLVDVRGHRRFAPPFVVLGSNPLAVYVVFQVAAAFGRRVGATWVPPLEAMLPPTALTLALAAVWTLIGYAFCLVLWRRRLFLTV